MRNQIQLVCTGVFSLAALSIPLLSGCGRSKNDQEFKVGSTPKEAATQLEQALRSQLAVNYLKPATRRHGILVVTHHRDRQWLDPATAKSPKSRK